MCLSFVFFFKQKTAYEVRISDWSSDVCSSDLLDPGTEYKELRALFPMYITPFQVAALARSGIESVSDLDGKVVGTGPQGGTGGTYWERDRKSVVAGKSVSVRVDLGGRRISKKKKRTEE